MAMLTTSLPKDEEWAKKLVFITKKCDELEKKIEKIDFLKQITFCDINCMEEDSNLRTIIEQYIVKTRAVSNQIKLEQEELIMSDIDMDDVSEASERCGTSELDIKPEIHPSPIITSRPARINERRPNLPNIYLPMTDGRIYNLVVKEEPVEVPELNDEETQILEGMKNFIDKILLLNNKK